METKDAIKTEVPINASSLFSAPEVEISNDENNEDGEEQLEKENSSEVSAGEGLREDLESALSNDFQFKGKFAFGGTLPAAPNPGLQVDSLGLIGLPLGEDDARKLKGFASRAPFGHGERLVVDTNVRDTWEVEPARITFTNPVWKDFMDDVVKNVCAELGVAPGASPPKCELYKLLLYEAGSHFLPHQDTEKAPGMFATVIIVLPSLYNGGQVHVSHGSQKQVFDFASSSESTYSLLTWYADVMHEVKPITAGHRLALSFNLIHTAPSLPVLAPSSMNTAKSELKHILHKWSKKAYAGAPQTIAYLLQHQYSQVDLAMGVNALKGVDAYLVGALREASAEEGIAVGLAELECHIMGDAGEDFGMGYSSKRARYDDYDDEEDEDMYSDDYDDTPTMGEKTERSMTVSNLVDLNGVNLIGKGTISLGEELIPKDAFENEDPDDQDYEGYMGNYPGSVEYWYHRTAIVLYLKANAQNILLEAGGITYAVAQLKSNNPTLPTPQDTAFANYIADHLSVQHINAGYYVADLALRWKNAPLWFEVACKCGADKNPDTLGKERLTAAWAVLGFEAIRPLFERAIAQCETLKNQVVMINSFSSRATSTQDQAVVTAWASEQTTFALEHLKPPTKEDVPIFIGVLKSKGMAFFVETLQPRLAKYETTYSFLTEFVKVLHANKTKLSNPPSTQGAFKQSIIYCLTAAVAQWKHSVRSQYGYIYGPAHHRAEHSLGRIKELVALCVSTGEMEPCEKLFSSLIQDSTGLQTKYKDIFIPLIPELRRILNSRNVGLDTRPFGDFFCYLIETYLHTVLGAKGARMRHNAIRKLGCGCSECQALDIFIFSAEATHTFRYVQAHRKHLEQRLSTASDIATFTTIRSGSPHGLQVTKHDDIVAATIWEERQKAARKFLTSFGGDAVVKLLMGARYSDVVKSVTGEKAYAWTAKPFPSSSTSIAQPTTSAIATTGVKTVDLIADSHSTSPVRAPLASSSNAPFGGGVVAGVKRKKLGFVDLTSSP